MKVFIEYDKSGAEWVIVAYLAGDARMIDVVQGNRSPHVVTGTLISGVPADLIQRENKVVGNHTDPDIISNLRTEHFPELLTGEFFLPRHMSIRQMGKKSNHGLNYNMRYKRFALENEMDESDAKTIVTKYREEAYPGIPVWHETIKRKLQKDRTLFNCFERKRVFRGPWGDELFDAAYSFIPQSTVFDVTREGMVRIYRDTSREFKTVELLAQVHDSVLTQMEVDSIDHLCEVAMRIDEYMNPVLEYSGREFRIWTTAKIGRNWSDMREVKIEKDSTRFRESMREAWEVLNVKKAA